MNLTADQERLLKQVVEHFTEEDKPVREQQIRTWRRLKLYWENFSKVWYSEVAHDWRVYDQLNAEDDQVYYDKSVNIFRAYLESIIAALSVVVPPVTCYPDDADNPLDLMTAKAGDKIAKLLFKHNNVNFLWVHALFTFCTEGMVACYNYNKEDKKFGTYEEPKYETVDELHEKTKCPECGYEFEDNTVMEGMPSPMGMPSEMCPECGMEVTPQVSQEPVTITRLIKKEIKFKSRQCMEVYGGLYVKVPLYAKKQEDCPYLIFNYETHYANARYYYPEIRDKIKGPQGEYESYERWGRISPQYRGDAARNSVTIRNCWLRPCAFEILQDEDAKKLQELFPDGARVVLVNEEFAKAEQEDLDDRWTLTTNPLSDYIHHDPLGLLLTSVQEITDDILSLTLQTIEHGIPQTFADPNVLNFPAYGKTEVSPGMIFPAQPKAGRTMGDAFYEVRTASLSAEVLPFGQQVQSLGQLVSGALPSLFGGSMAESKTASEYSMSRAQALQRLQNIWKIFTFWWRENFRKMIPAYIENLKEDEKFVEKDKDGNYINIFIRKAELEGKIGSIELEANENLPMSFGQVRDVIMQLLQANNPEIQATLAVPENLPIIREAIGLTDFFIPGEDDRNKQYDEIKLLLNSEPFQIPQFDPMTQMAVEQEQPSIEVDAIFDNHQVQFEICRKWIISDAGRMAKNENPMGYRNVLLHAQMHYQLMIQSMAPVEGSASPTGKPTEQDREAPIMGEENVATQQ